MVHAWLDGALSPDEAARIERLVRDDPAWAAAAAEARGLIANASRLVRALDDAPLAGAPASAWGGGAPSMASLRRPWGRRLAAIAAALLVAVVGRQAWREAAPPTEAVTRGAERSQDAPVPAASGPAGVASRTPIATAERAARIVPSAPDARPAASASQSAKPAAPSAPPAEPAVVAPRSARPAEAASDAAPGAAANAVPAASARAMVPTAKAAPAPGAACERVRVAWGVGDTVTYDGAPLTVGRAGDSVEATMPLPGGALRATVGGRPRSGPAALLARDGTPVRRGVVVSIDACLAAPPRD